MSEEAQQLSRSDFKQWYQGQGSPNPKLFKQRYEGMSRLVERELGYNTGAIYSRTPDAYGRIQNITLAGGFFVTSSSNKTDYWYCYNNRSQAKFRHERAFGGLFSEQYSYDGLARLIDWRRGRAIPLVDCSLPNNLLETPVETQTWTLDHSNNWTTAVNKTNELVDNSMITYDNNGNLTGYYGIYYYSYDGWNRLKTTTNTYLSSGASYLQTDFQYNGLGQLVRQQSWGLSQSTNNSDDQYYYGADGRLIEERAKVGLSYNAKKQYFWGNNYVDELVLTRNCLTNAIEYYIQDANWNVVAITNGTTSIKERYRYSAYGIPTKLTANWLLGAGIDSDGPLYTGQRYSWLNGIYNYKARWLDPGRGRFLQVDVGGVWDDALQYGNGYAYTGSDPLNWTDSQGLAAQVSLGKDSGDCGVDNSPISRQTLDKNGASTFIDKGAIIAVGVPLDEDRKALEKAINNIDTKCFDVVYRVFASAGMAEQALQKCCVVVLLYHGSKEGGIQTPREGGKSTSVDWSKAGKDIDIVTASCEGQAIGETQQAKNPGENIKTHGLPGDQARSSLVQFAAKKISELGKGKPNCCKCCFCVLVGGNDDINIVPKKK